MMRRRVVAVDLGGSAHRCLADPPRDPPPAPEVVRALVERALAEGRGGTGRIEVGFFRGGLPGHTLLDAAGGLPVRLACHPLDLDRAAARRLREAGADTVEIEVLTFDEEVLWGIGRRTPAARLEAQLRGLRAMGFRVGAVLAPGLPGSSHAGAVADARRVAEGGLADFVRILPAVAWRGSGLECAWMEGLWRPMTVAQAVTTALAMVRVFEAHGVEVARIGVQPGRDLPHRASAGPVHPDLRGLVEMRRFRERMGRALRHARPGARARLRVHPKDLAWARGIANDNVRALRARLRLRDLDVVGDEAVARGRVEPG